ncbi:MAG: CZB domain-containing protein [Gammaproteobacteria bacterium]|nr:CZB domain-containing protein [Gammaproteobacteria bacterium]
MDLNHAIEKHAEWKVKFRSAIGRHESMDAATIAKDNCCELGKWLHGEGKATHGTLPGYAQCLAKHAAFHVEAGKVAHAINARKYGEADTMLGAGSAYVQASSAVAIAIMQLKKESGL